MQLKDFASITASMLNIMRASQDRITDFEVGSVARTMLEAAAAEMDELYQQMFSGIRLAIPVSVYQTFGFPVRGAEAASGVVRVEIAPISDATLIPAGTLFQRTAAEPGGRQYVALDDTAVPALASFADIAVVAEAAGASGNVPPGALFRLSPEPLSFVRAEAVAGLRGGSDAETEDERRARFAEFVQSLERGTPRALRFGATTAFVADAAGNPVERVTSAAVVEPHLLEPLLYTPGLVWLYVENRTGLPSPALLQRCQDIIDGFTTPEGVAVPGWKPAGVVVEVRPALRQAVTVSGVLAPLPGEDGVDLARRAREFAADYLTRLPIAQPALRADLVAGIMALGGVRNIRLAQPAADVPAGPFTKLAAGAVSIVPGPALAPP